MSERATPDPLLDRRTLLRGTVAAAAAGALGCASSSKAPGAAAVSASATGPSGPLKVGLVGLGGRGVGAGYNALLAEDGSVVMTAVADLFPDRLESGLQRLEAALGEERADRLQVSEANRFTGFDGYRKVIDSGVDVVCLATPPVFRPEQLDYAVRAGKHVFCEKPMAVDAPGLRQVLETARVAREKRLSIVSGFCWRYNVRHQALYQRLQQGAIGDVQVVYATYYATPIGTHAREEGWSDREWMLRNWHHFYELSGDHVVEQAVHSIDKIAWTFGDVPPQRVLAMGGNQTKRGPEAGNTFDHFSATYDYAGGARALLSCRQMANCATENNDYVYGTKGTAEVQGWTPLHDIRGENAWSYEGESNDMYQAELDRLFAAIRAGQPVNDGEWMATSTMMGLMARMSAYTGRVITWEEAMASEERLTPETWSLGPAQARPMAVPGETPFV